MKTIQTNVRIRKHHSIIVNRASMLLSISILSIIPPNAELSGMPGASDRIGLRLRRAFPLQRLVSGALGFLSATRTYNKALKRTHRAAELGISGARQRGANTELT
jgi:hypothetical protein